MRRRRRKFFDMTPPPKPSRWVGDQPFYEFVCRDCGARVATFEVRGGRCKECAPAKPKRIVMTPPPRERS